MIATFPSLKYNIDDFPAVKKYLLAFGYDRLKQNGDKGARKKTGNKWFETQDSISYSEDFSKQKIVWAELARTGNSFAFDGDLNVVLNTSYILTLNGNNENNNMYKYLLGILNSKTILHYMNNISNKLDVTGWRWLRQFVEQLPIPIPQCTNDFYDLPELVNKVYEQKKRKINTLRIEASIDEIVYQLYGLTQDEQEFIGNNNYRRSKNSTS